jgi:hypothetical protein
MTDPISERIAVSNAEERLRQERETFNQRKQQDARWFVIRQAMSWVAIILVPTIAATCGWIIFDHHDFTTATVTIAASALLFDILGLFISIWKIILGSGPQTLVPITQKINRRDRPADNKQSQLTTLAPWRFRCAFASLPARLTMSGIGLRRTGNR